MEPLSKILATGAPSSFAINMPIPTNNAKTISGSTLTSAITCTGLCGTMDRIISRQPVTVASGISPFIIVSVLRPMPGLNHVPNARPNQTEIWPVTTNSNIALPPTLPSFRKSPIAATPETRLKNISGTTNILIDAMKKSPIHFILSASGPHNKPVITPRINAAITRCQSGIRNQKASIIHIPQLLICGEPTAEAHLRQAVYIHKVIAMQVASPTPMVSGIPALKKSVNL